MYCIVSCSDENVSRQKIGKSTTVSQEDNPGSAPQIPKIVLSKKGPGGTYIQKPPSEVTQAGNADLLVGSIIGSLRTSSSQVPVAAGVGGVVPESDVEDLVLVSNSPTPPSGQVPPAAAAGGTVLESDVEDLALVSKSPTPPPSGQVPDAAAAAGGIVAEPEPEPESVSDESLNRILAEIDEVTSEKLINDTVLAPESPNDRPAETGVEEVQAVAGGSGTVNESPTRANEFRVPTENTQEALDDSTLTAHTGSSSSNSSTSLNPQFGGLGKNYVKSSLS